MKASKITLLISLFVISLISLGTWTIYSNQSTSNASAEINEEEVAGRTEITYLAEADITSLEQLQNMASDVVVTESAYGKLVDSIEGHKGGVDGYYWSFYVNGEMAQVGADSYVQKEGDLIEWKFQKL